MVNIELTDYYTCLFFIRLKSAPGLSGVVPDESQVLVFKNALHRVVDVVTPKVLVRDMNGTYYFFLRSNDFYKVNN